MDTLHIRKLILGLLTMFVIEYGHSQGLTATILVVEKITSSSSANFEIIVVDTLGNQQTIIPSNFFTLTGIHEKELNIQLNYLANIGYKICSTTSYSYGNYNSIFYIWTRYIFCNGEEDLGFNNLTTQNNVLLFPNPATEEIRIILNDPKLVSTNYSIVDVLGKEVLNGMINSEVMYISIASLKAGTYYFKNSQMNSKASMFIKN